MANIERFDAGLVSDIKAILESAKRNIVRSVNSEMVHAYWHIGKRLSILEDETNQDSFSESKTMIMLSKELTKVFGRGFSRSNLFNMKKLHKLYPTVQTVSGLSWSHYCELLAISDDSARSFYEKEASNSRWSVRELKRQIETSLFERILLSSGNKNKEKVISLAKAGVKINRAEDILKDPYVLDFVGLSENKPILEKDLEKALINKLEKFLLELGRGFMFVGSQQRITIGNIHYYVDLVFYNKILRAYVLIDLKTRSLKPENAGQMNAYLNYYTNEVNEETDAKPIGIILCANTSEIAAEYALGGLENQIFASKYTYYIPNKETLIKQVEEVVQASKSLKNLQTPK